MGQTWDVVVIGGGGCGLVTAIGAAERGGHVLLLEKQQQLGGNTAYSVGSVPGAGTRYQREAGIDDSPQRFAEDLLRQTSGDCDEERVRHLAAFSAELVHWLVDVAHLPLRLTTDYKHVGHSVNRLHNPPTREGRELTEGLHRVAQELNVEVRTSSPVTRLGRDSDSWRVVVGSAGEPETVRAPKVVLATDGFGANDDMKRQYCPEAADMAYIGAPGNSGDGIRFGVSSGAVTENMASYLAYALMASRGDQDPSFETLFSWTVPEIGGVIVDELGKRFANEDVGYSAFADAVVAKANGVGYVVFDQRILTYVSTYEPRFKELAEGADSPIILGDSLADVAAAAGLPADELADTVGRYNESAGGNRRDEFGREVFGIAPLEAPFCIARTSPGLLTTQGGLRTNLDAQVLGEQGVIAGLYAGGSTAAGISGSAGGRGYASGNGLLTAFGWGLLAARHATSALHSSS